MASLKSDSARLLVTNSKKISTKRTDIHSFRSPIFIIVFMLNRCITVKLIFIKEKVVSTQYVYIVIPLPDEPNNIFSEVWCFDVSKHDGSIVFS